MKKEVTLFNVFILVIGLFAFSYTTKSEVNDNYKNNKIVYDYKLRSIK